MDGSRPRIGRAHSRPRSPDGEDGETRRSPKSLRPICRSASRRPLRAASDATKEKRTFHESWLECARTANAASLGPLLATLTRSVPVEGRIAGWTQRVEALRHASDNPASRRRSCSSSAVRRGGAVRVDSDLPIYAPVVEMLANIGDERLLDAMRGLDETTSASRSVRQYLAPTPPHRFRVTPESATAPRSRNDGWAVSAGAFVTATIGPLPTLAEGAGWLKFRSSGVHSRGPPLARLDPVMKPMSFSMRTPRRFIVPPLTSSSYLPPQRLVGASSGLSYRNGQRRPRGSARDRRRERACSPEAASSCVVHGMPRAVLEAGLAEAEFPLDDMARAIVERL